MSYEGKRVYVIPELAFGEVVKEEDDGFVVLVNSVGKKFEKKYGREDLRLWSERIEEACGRNRKCWGICGEKLE